jgi:nucleotide-binding universal stress UspA family protein
MGLGFERGTDGPRVIVAAIDGSTTSMRGVAYAAGLARRQGAELVVVFVGTFSAMANFVPSAGPALNEATHDIAADLRHQIERAAEQGLLNVRFVERQGDPYTEIAKVCTDVLADAVVVGASTSAGHRLVGSLGVRLVRAGRWPVTVVP